MSADIGIYGLTAQGINLALNIASKGYFVTVGNKSSDKIKECIELSEKEDLEEKVKGIKDVEDFCKSLKTPRKVVLLSRSGTSIDRSMQKIIPLLESGDIIIDGSCDSTSDCARRATEVEPNGIQYITMGITGSNDEARSGPCFLVSGPKACFDEIEPILNKVAAEVDHHACVGYMGTGSAAAFVKMVCDSIEMGEMQLLSEIYDIMRQARMSNSEMSDLFSEWNREDSSYLLGITSTIISKKDCDVDGCKVSEAFLVEKIMDQAPLTVSGVNILSESATAHLSVSAITASIFEKYVSTLKTDRVKISATIKASKFDWSKLNLPDVLKDLKLAYQCTRIVMYSQAFNLMKGVSNSNNWAINLAEVARVLRGGCAIRCGLLERICDVYEKDCELTNLLLSESFSTQWNEQQTALRRILSLSVISGATLPTVSAALAYVDSYRRERLPGALIQCLRDLMCGEMFERVDKKKGELFHCRWTK